MQQQTKRNSQKSYALGALLLFTMEVGIVLFAHDGFIRPYLGDYLVVLFLYCLLMAISKVTVRWGLVAILALG